MSTQEFQALVSQSVVIDCHGLLGRVTGWVDANRVRIEWEDGEVGLFNADDCSLIRVECY